MTLDPRCPSCGHQNTADATQCARCNFPLREAAPAEPAGPDVMGAHAEPGEARPVEISRERIRPIRPRRPSGPEQTLKLQLWLILGSLAIAAVLWTAWQGFQKSNAPQQQIAGAQEAQQQAADMARAELARDSTNVNARVALANVLYDTANWPEAIIHYMAALRMDPTRATAIVDLGVCYFNLSQVDEAEALFKRALTLDPNQPVALFNLGIVSETRGLHQQALDYYHRAMRAGPPDNMAQALNDAMQRVMQKLGKGAPKLEGGAGGAGPGGTPGGR